MAAVVVWFLLYRTVFGYKIRTVGLSPGAAAYAGISWGRTIALAMLLSGLLAGLGGAVDALGLHGRYYNVMLGLGFTSIAVGLVGRNNPFGVVLAGLLFGALAAGATEMQNTAGISRDIVYVLLAFVILSVSALAVVAAVPPVAAAGSPSARHDPRPGRGRRGRSAGGVAATAARDLTVRRPTLDAAALVLFGGTADGDAALGGAARSSPRWAGCSPSAPG